MINKKNVIIHNKDGPVWREKTAEDRLQEILHKYKLSNNIIKNYGTQKNKRRVGQDKVGE